MSIFAISSRFLFRANCFASRDQWKQTFDTNIHSVFYMSKYTIPHLKNGSTIINCASVNCYIGRPDLIDYTATKGAMVAFTRALSNQQVGNGIRVNCVCPGPGKSRFNFSRSLQRLICG